ncbi:hypothetical protein Pmar_PMAR000879 [Perkinsus marinus ATCC 50983]|uniref:Uncharacterized protein n=1 Tax=Perkinsus marinus (strain ATCC 50983 / TXsc) TaxID=423536 RepID=C5KXW4_PERM5|nr:hypothetical protein Pmar_PMAR000879 [Perkinsus marinus ATCC 50983]EER10838.1 hypothetical protein Pmar_PMAR000879 [Perkinsus marinus ATCC 50983]|eukprot:XP_002779043.1 hypothetical protein Pmar_PMAR000879 [Perkinsus marinus ATCC 50983]
MVSVAPRRDTALSLRVSNERSLAALVFVFLFDVLRLGRVMENCRNPAVKIIMPDIDSDLLRYDPSSTSLKREMGKLVEELPEAIGNVVNGMSTDPATARDGLRQFETLVKSMYHGLEILREHEAKRLALQLAREQVDDLVSTLGDMRAATEAAKEVLGPEENDHQQSAAAIDEIVSVKTEGLSTVEDRSPKRRKKR